MFEKIAGTVTAKVTNMVEMVELASNGKSLRNMVDVGDLGKLGNLNTQVHSLITDPQFATSREKTRRYLEPGP